MSIRPQTANAKQYSFHFGSPRTNKLTRQQTRKKGKTFVIAIDGSAVGHRGLDVAAGIMRPGEDFVKIVTISVGVVDVPDPKDLNPGHALTPESMLNSAKSHLIARGVPAVMISTDEIVPEEESVSEAIVAQTDQLRKGAGVLVLGAIGKGAQRKAGDAGKGLGSVADYALLHAKCPVLMVKDKDVYEGHEHSVRPPLSVVCCVDKTTVRRTHASHLHHP